MNVNQMFRYLNIGLPDDIYRRKVAGDFCGAIRLIDRRLDMGNLPEPLRYSLIVQREICRRMPADYPYTREEALSVLREKVPDFTDEEFDRCVEEGKIGWIYVNGRMQFFNRFFASMCKTDPGFAVRSGVMLPGVESAVSSFGGKNRLDYCVHQIKEKGILKNRIRIRASVRMKDECFTPGVFVRVHLPIPAACEQQSDIVIEKMEPPCGKIAPQDALQRTICFEETMKENHSFSVVYSYVYTASYHNTEKMHGKGKQPDFFTQEEPPHIVFTPYIRELVGQLSGDIEDPMEKARRFYDYITQNMKYSFMPAYFNLEHIADSCARNCLGDCGVFSLLFLTMCRCAKIPACWQSGLTAEPDFCGAHDWVRFYVAPYGWLYADPSYGIAAVRNQNEERRKFYFGNLDAYRMAANRAFQAPFTIEKQHWRADPYDNQVGEMETETKGLEYDEFLCMKEVLMCEEM